MNKQIVRSQEITDRLQDVQAILRAAHFAAVKHKDQRRKGVASEPYINHLVQVADLVSSALTEPDANLVIAALLHDAIEDVGVTKEEIVEQFGSDVADLVLEVTDDKSLSKRERKRLQIINAPKKSIRAQFIKLADKISNLRTILAAPRLEHRAQTGVFRLGQEGHCCPHRAESDLEGGV